MKNYFIKRVFTYLCFILISIFLFINFIHIKIQGNSIVYDDSNTAGYTVNSSTVKTISTTKHMKDLGSTIEGSTNYAQQVNVLMQACDQDSKVVTWAIRKSDGSGFIRNNIATIARDYEKNHPGWKVTGGINADQYYPKYGVGGHADGSDYFYPQPYGPFIADGENWFSISAKPYGGNGTYIAGFLNDGSNDQIVEGKTNWTDTSSKRVYISGLYLSILDEYGEVEAKYKIDNFNEAPLNQESTLYTSFYQQMVFPNKSVSGESLFVVEHAEMAYVSNSETYTYKADYDAKNINNAQNAFFGKGFISSIQNSFTLGIGQFAIETKNPDLKANLGVGKRILVQYEYDGVMNEVESATAYHTIMRMDNKDNNSTSSYNTTRYPRSMFGRTSDGNIVLITIDGRQASKGMNGTNQYEGNAVLKYYGVVEAYQMDGGGSVTMVVRDNGDFKVVNSPSDGAPRSVLTGLFFVTRDVKIGCEQTSSTSNSVELNVNVLNTFERIVGETYVEINSKHYLVKDNYVTINNLEPGKEYKYQIYVKDLKGVFKTDSIGVLKTSKNPPILNICPYSIIDNKYVFTPNINDIDSTITDVKLKIGSTIYELNDGKFIVNEFNETDDVILIYKYKLSTYEGEVIEEYLNPMYYSSVILEQMNKLQSKYINQIFK